MERKYINHAITSQDEKIGGNYAILNVRKNAKWIDRDRHFDSADEARRTMKPGRADGIRECLLERIATLFDDGKKAVVRYAVIDRNGNKIGGADVTWIRGGEPNWTENQKAPFNSFGAGLGFEGSDWVEEIKTDL